MNEIKTQSYKYYLGAADVGGKTNQYSGSVSIRKDGHNALYDEFRYRVLLEKDENDEFCVVAQHYIGNVSFDNIEQDKILSCKFEGSEEGATQAKEWLQKAYDLYMKEMNLG